MSSSQLLFLSRNLKDGGRSEKFCRDRIDKETKKYIIFYILKTQEDLMTFLEVEIKDWIQIGIMVALFFTLLVSILQTRTHHKLFMAQLLKDRLSMYRGTRDIVSDRVIEMFELYPEEYMKREMFEKKYKGNKAAIKRYIHMSELYEYLVFNYALKKLNLPDPLAISSSSCELWTKELVKEEEFRDVHRNYAAYYKSTEFVGMVQRLIKDQSLEQVTHEKPTKVSKSGSLKRRGRPKAPKRRSVGPQFLSRKILTG